MFRFMIPLAFAFVTLGTVWAAPSLPPTVDEIATFQQRDDGKYDVVCKSGEREVATDLDLQLNNVCPHKSTGKPSNILSVQKRDDGQFDVVCTDQSKKVATAQQIIDGSVCVSNPPTPPKSVIEAGYYEAVSGYTSWCPQQVTPKMTGDTLTGLSIQHVGGCSVTSEYTCSGNVCNGSVSSYKYRVTIQDSKHYEFASGDGANPGIFEFKR